MTKSKRMSTHLQFYSTGLTLSTNVWKRSKNTRQTTQSCRICSAIINGVREWPKEEPLSFSSLDFGFYMSNRLLLSPKIFSGSIFQGTID